MSNLARTQADWNKLGRELGLFLGASKALADVERKFDVSRNRTQIVEQSSVNGFTSSWKLTGVKIGSNTDELGTIFVRVTDENPGAGQALIDLYKAAGAGAGNKVATGSAADNGTITFAAANSSGMGGTVKIGVVTANETDDKHRLLVFPDFGLRAAAVFDLSEVEHAELLGSFLNELCAEVTQKLVEARAAVRSHVEGFLSTRWKDFMKSGQSAAITKNTNADQGAITTSYAGLLEDGRADMRDEATAGAQKVVKNVIAAAAPVFDAVNQGLGALTTPTMEEWAAPGLITLVCNDATIGQEKFSITQHRDDTGRDVVAQNDLQLGRVYADPAIGIRGMTLTRTITLDTGSTNDFAAGANWAFTGETKNNTNDGLIYLKVIKGVVDNTKWILNGYTSNSYSSDTQVFTTAEVAAATATPIVAVNSSGLSGTAKTGAAPTDAHTGSINLNPFRTQNVSQGVPDKITIAITVTSKGEFQDRIAELFAYWLNSAASGGETLAEGYVSAGTFPPYSVRDA